MVSAHTAVTNGSMPSLGRSVAHTHVHTCTLTQQRAIRYSNGVIIPSLSAAAHRLLNDEGSLMAFAGKSDKKETVTAAIAANIWMSTEKSSQAALPDEKLQFIVLDCLVSAPRQSRPLQCVYT